MGEPGKSINPKILVENEGQKEPEEE